jgi:phosphoribosylglycinamide formyltransferase-1
MRHKPKSAEALVSSIVVLISGRGSNLHSILKAGLTCKVAAVISNRADAGGLQLARDHGIPTAVVSHKDYPDRAAFDAALAQTIDGYQPDLVVLAGFMRILTSQFVERYRGRLINIHPSLLPAYTGLDTHARALADGVKIHGCTVHYVTGDLDHGPIIAQAAVPVLASDTADSLAARVLREEHRIYPQAIRWISRGHVVLADDGTVCFKRLEQPGPALISPSLD